MHAHPLRAALPLFLLAGFCFSSLDATGKYLVRDHALFVVVWARYAGQLIVVTPWVWHRAGPGFWRTRRWKMQVVRASFLLVATAFFFAGLRYLPLAEGTAIAFLAPIFIVLLSKPLLGESPTRARMLAALAGFIGVVIMVRPGSAVFHPAVLFLLAAGLSNAMYNIFTRKLAAEDVRTTLFYTALTGTALLTPLLPFGLGDATFTLADVGFLLLLGLLAGVGHWAVITAYTLAPPSMLSPYGYLQMIWATVYGYLVFHQAPDVLSALGMAVIVGSGVLLALQERRAPRLG